jgi:hypothetical protein
MKMGAHVPYDPDTEMFLNNFYTRFPSGIGTYPQGLDRATWESDWHKTHREVFRSWDTFTSVEDFDDFCSRLSDRYLDETPEQFFAELDRTVIEVGLSPDIIMEKIQASKNDHLSSREESLDRDEYLKPVYIAMRNKGYNKKELFG